MSISKKCSESLKRFLFDTADLHLRYADEAGNTLLRQAVIVSKLDNKTFLIVQAGKRLLQGHAFEQPFLHAVGAQDILKREALLAGLALDGLSRAGSCFGGCDFLRRKAQCLGKLGYRRVAAKIAGQALTRFFDGGSALFYAAANFDCAVVAQEAADFPGNLGNSIGGKLRAVSGVKALDCL